MRMGCGTRCRRPSRPTSRRCLELLRLREKLACAHPTDWSAAYESERRSVEDFFGESANLPPPPTRSFNQQVHSKLLSEVSHCLPTTSSLGSRFSPWPQPRFS